MKRQITRTSFQKYYRPQKKSNSKTDVVLRTTKILHRGNCTAVIAALLTNLLMRFFSAKNSALEKIFLLFFLRPFVRIRRRRFAFDDRLPHLRELLVERGEFLLRIRNVVLGEDRFHRAFGNTQRAVDAFVRIDYEHVRTFAEAVDRADVDAVGVLALDAAFGDDVSHLRSRV